MKIYKAPLFIIALVTLFSCGNSYVLTSEQLEDLLVDVHLAEGIVIGNSAQFRKHEDKFNLYNTVYAKHGTDKAQFDSTLSYYSENLLELTEIYDRVYTRLEAMEEEVLAGNFSPVKGNIKNEAYARVVSQDSDLLPYINKELWLKSRSFTFSDVDFEKGKSYEFLIDTLVNGKVELRYAIDMDSLESAQCIMTMHYDDDKSEDKVFEIDLEGSPLIKHSWSLADAASPTRVSIKFDAVPMNKNKKLRLIDLRLYDLTNEAHNISIF